MVVSELHKQWGFRCILTPRKFFKHNNADFLLNILTDSTALLCHIATSIISENIKDSLRYPQPIEFFSSPIFKNGLESYVRY